MTAPLMHSIRCQSDDEETITASCGSVGTKCSITGRYRRIGGHSIRLTHDAHRVTCKVCIRYQAMAADMEKEDT